MTFLQPLFFGAILAAAIPLLLHLISRWQSRRVDLGTTRFLLEILQDQAHRKQIRRWLLLAMRMALIALLVFLFMRPSLPRASRRDGDRTRLILVDRSASMAVRSANGRLVDVAISKAREAMSELGADARKEVAFFDSNVAVVEAADTSSLTAPSKLNGGTRYAEALRWARDRSIALPNDRVDVVVITDLQRSGLDGAEEIGMPPDVAVQLVDVGREVSDNLGVLDLRVPDGIRPPGEDLNVSATIFNFGPADHVDVPVIVTARCGEAKHYVRKTVSVPAGQAVDVEATLVSVAAGRWEILLDLDCEDDFLDDNRRRTASLVADPARVLVLDGGSRARDETYFLRTALRSGKTRWQLDGAAAEPATDSAAAGEAANQAAPPVSRFRPDVVYLEEGNGVPDPTRYPLVIVADPGDLPATEIESLHAYVSDGGQLIVFAGHRLAEKLCSRLGGIRVGPRSDRTSTAGRFRPLSNDRMGTRPPDARAVRRSSTR